MKAKVTGPQGPFALTSVMKHLVLAHLKSITDSALDPLQLAYKANRFTEDPVNMAVLYVLKHLDTTANYARILCVDFSLPFNTILPSTLETQISLLQVPAPTRRWVMDILTTKSQRVKLGKYISSSRFTGIGSRQGCILSPMLFSLYTNSCTSLHTSVKLLKFVDDTTLVGLIPGGMSSYIGARSSSCGVGAAVTTWNSTPRRQLSCWWTSGQRQPRPLPSHWVAPQCPPLIHTAS